MKRKEMAPKYNFKEVEKGKYKYWIDQGFFTSGDINKRPYTIVIPPPNVLENFIWVMLGIRPFNIIIRRKRMQGYDALYLPGMDHAGIATQAKVMKN